jgi:autotransporter-associated beta strand protein
MVQVGANGTTGSLGSGAVVVSGSSYVLYDRSDDFSVTNVFTGGLPVIDQMGTGTMNFAGSLVGPGNMKVDSGRMVITGSVNGDIDCYPLGGEIEFAVAAAVNGIWGEYPGSAVVDAGVVVALDGESGDVTNNGTLLFNDMFGHAEAAYIDGTISGSGNISKYGPGALRLRGSLTHTGTTTINQGSLVVGDGDAGGYLGNASIIDNGELRFWRSSMICMQNAISGTGGLYQDGPEMTILIGTITNSGGTTVNAGTLYFGGTWDMGAGGATVASGAQLDVNSESVTGSITNAGTTVIMRGFEDSLSQITNTGTVQLYTDVDFSGQTLNGGVFELLEGFTGTLASGTLTLNGATLQIDPGATFNWSGGTIVYNDGASFADFDAVGDGVTNDSPVLQAVIDAAPAGTTLVLQADKTYLLNVGLVVNKPLNIEGNGATLLLNTSAWPQNETLLYKSAVSPTKDTWTESVVAGQTTLQVAVPVSERAPGDKIDLQLGQDPYDLNQPHYERVVTVLANTGSSITIDQPVPYDINQGTLSHGIQKITSLVENSTIRDVCFDFTSIGTPDTQIWIDRARNMTVQNLSGRFSIAVLVSNSQNVSIDGISGELKNVHGAAGRALNVWQSDNVTETNVDVTSDSTQPAVFLESWAHDITITNFQIAYQTAPTQQLPWVFAVVGGSYGVYGDQIYIDNPGLAALVDSGGQPSDYHFGAVTMTGPILYLPLDRIDNFHDGAITFNNAVHVDMIIPLSPGANGTMIPLVHGTIKSITVTASSTTGINNLWLLNAQYAGWDFGSSLVAGQPLYMTGKFGSDYPFNSLGALDKYLAPYTSTNLPVGTTLTVSIDYYPGS